MKIIETKNVSFRYKHSKSYAIRDINYSFDKGIITAIMGESGVGKTTLLMLLAGLDSGYTGDILYKDINIKKINQNKYRSKNIGIIFQNFNLLPHSTAIDNVRMGLYLSGYKNNTYKKAVDLLSQVGIAGDMQNKRCIHLSGGEQQRVAIARALSDNKDIILADEPTGNLDEKNEKSILEIFKNLAYIEKKCVIIVTHSKNVLTYSDKVFNL